MKHKRWIFFVLALSIVFLFVSCGSSAGEETGEKEMKANEIIVHDFSGNEVNLVNGRPVYIKAWASWCPVCLAGMGELNELSAEDNGFDIVSVVSPGEYGEMDEQDFIAWWNGLDYDNITVYFDEGAALFDELGIRAFPTSAYYDSNGELVTTIIGHNDNNTIISTMADIE